MNNEADARIIKKSFVLQAKAPKVCDRSVLKHTFTLPHCNFNSPCLYPDTMLLMHVAVCAAATLVFFFSAANTEFRETLWCLCL